VASVDSCLRLFSSRSSHGHLVGETDRRSTTGADIPDDWRGSGKADYSQLGIELVAVSDDAPSSLWPRTIGDASSDTHPGHARTFARLNAAGRDAVRCALKAVAGTRPQAARPRDDTHADRRVGARPVLAIASSRAVAGRFARAIEPAPSDRPGRLITRGYRWRRAHRHWTRTDSLSPALGLSGPRRNWSGLRR
jgi:hypothetical protein